jgi:hypothetical protein
MCVCACVRGCVGAVRLVKCLRFQCTSCSAATVGTTQSVYVNLQAAQKSIQTLKVYDLHVNNFYFYFTRIGAEYS